MIRVPHEEGFWRTLRYAFEDAPRRSRWSLWMLAACGATALGFQFWDVAGRHGPMVMAELASVVFGTVGSLLVGVAYVLHGGTQSAAGCAPGGWRFETRVPHQLLLALPLVGVVAGGLLGSSVGLLLLRAVNGRPLLLLAVAIYGWIFVLAAGVVTRTNRFLYRLAREEAEAAALAREQAGEARLAALQAQMNPHFLFNALNTVASLVRTSPEAAETTVENLAGVLRRTLARSRSIHGTVGEEVDYLEAYLAVEQERWGERLRVSWFVDPATRDLPLPPLSLQPLVENALRHGLGERIEGGRLEIRSELAHGQLRLTVSDDGGGFDPRAPEGTGLGNLRSRLATLYGEAASLRLEAAGPGTRAVVELPARQLRRSTQLASTQLASTVGAAAGDR